jgi:hypothetical protein
VTMYLDSDKDGYGDSAHPGLVCPGDSRYVSNANDCDDGPNGASFYPGAPPICSTVMERKWCSTTGGTVNTEPCDQGCMNGVCRKDGTIGVPGYVSCNNSSHCPAADGCQMDEESGACGMGVGSFVFMYCDGPNDCPGQKCVMYNAYRQNEARCYPSVPAGNDYHEICDPLASTCQPPLVCTQQGRYLFYQCQ